jgi:hypothetical protein
MDFRLYDNALGRFFGIDALSEQNHYLSTYNFADGNPVVFSDPSGLDSIGGYDPKDVYGNHKHMFRGNNQFVDVVALLAGNSAGGSSSNASASFADLDKKIDNFFSDKSKNAPRELTFVEIAGSWEPYDPTTILLEEVVVTGSMGNLVFPIEKMQKIIETAQQRFNAKFGRVNGGGASFPLSGAIGGAFKFGDVVLNTHTYLNTGSFLYNIDYSANTYHYRGTEYGIGKYRNAPLNIANQKNLNSYVKFGKGVGKVLGVAGFGVTLYQAGSEFSNGRNVAGTARLAVAGIAAGVAFIPVAGWFIAGGIAIADAIWGDKFYNYLQNEYGN